MILLGYVHKWNSFEIFIKQNSMHTSIIALKRNIEFSVDSSFSGNM